MNPTATKSLLHFPADTASCLQPSENMAAAAQDDLHPLKRNQSYQFLPPEMSELRVVLLGNSWSERSSVGNFIFRETEFNTEEEPDGCLKVRRQIKEKDIVLINTPDLLSPHISEDRLTEHVTDCVSLSDPGPYVFLLVLQPEDFSEEHKQRLCRVLQRFSDRSFDHSLILISSPREESPVFMEELVTDQPLKDMIIMCGNRYLRRKNTDLLQLLTWLAQTSMERDVWGKGFIDKDAGLFMKPELVSENTKPALNLVLCGRRGAGKTSAAKAILGQTGLHSASSSSECVKHQGEVCGRWVSLVELPALCGEPLETVMEESLRCVSLCDPEGVHAFIMVLPVGPLIEEDKGELEIIQEIFSSGVSDFTMILFPVQSDPTAPAVVNFLQKNKEVQDLIQSCGGRSFVLNIKDQQQIPELLETVAQMRGFSRFTKDMFTKAQIEKVVRLEAELQDVKQRSEKGSDDELQNRECLRMVLIGNTGWEKSAVAHTILGKDVFESSLQLKTCQKATGEIDGEPVAVFHTPALTSADFQNQIKNCLSMCSPGPHVFLLVLQIGKFTQEEKDSVELIKRVFGKKSQDFILITFTRGEELADQSAESYVEDCGGFLKQLIDDCGGRYHVFNDSPNHTQVKELLTKIKTMVKENGGCYNTERLEDVDGVVQMHVQKISKEKDEEMKRKDEELRRKHKEDVKTLEKTISELRSGMEQEKKTKAKQLTEKDECINKEREQRKKEKEEEERKWEKKDEDRRKDWQRKLEGSEKIVQSERQQRENADRKLEQYRKEMKRDREAWDKERNDLWERIQQENKQNLEEEKTRLRNLQEEYYSKRRKWTYIFFVLSLLLALLVFYLFLK
ncbi:GTPase IMAP family member 8-like [Notolabrus celidotus]|uniref:GTPase IMAP family member 8-like n=1 Tax=Notolabrus celidotus TaxID=1203425 RepID=UPI00148F73D0|nr:GTPase IMAP family member 8-like [Notolabrus celidotus]